MGGALSSKANQPVQLILLGLDYAGKSSVLARLAGEEMRCLQPTRGFTIKTLSVGGSGLVKVWDLGGGRDVRGYWPAYYEKAQGVVFVIDSSDSRRLHEVSSMLQCVLDEPSLSSTPLLLLANKQDLPQALHTSELEDVLHLASIKDRAWICLACSALRGSGLSEGFVWLHQNASTS